MGFHTRGDVVVLGAGISGLTTALALAEAGFAVRVHADRPPERTTSCLAGASWGPYLVSDDRVLRWSLESYEEFGRLSRAADVGVRLVPGLETFVEPLESLPEWVAPVTGYRRCPDGELPPGYASGWYYTVPIVDMPVYLAYLRRRLNDVGGSVHIGPAITSVADVAGAGATVVNCTGLGSRALVPDLDVRPSAGQLVVIENPGIDRFFQDHQVGHELTCILPHRDHVILGGFATEVDLDTRPEDLEWEPAADEKIIARCAAIEPAVAGARIIGHRVGLRPNRPTVRVEWDPRPDMPLVHNYGHGGSGVTLSWGCAREVLRLVESGR